MSNKEPKLATHDFIPSGQNAIGVPICTCGSLRTDAVHRRAGLTDEQRAAQARRTGDRP